MRFTSKMISMKNIIIIIITLFIAPTLKAQLKKTAACPVFKIDILEGNLNDGLNPTSGAGEIKAFFPCFTEKVEVATGSKCAGVFYKDKDIYFYTDKSYIEIRQNFKGKLSLPLLGARRGSTFKWLGYPKIKDVNWDAFKTKYGILILYYNKAGKIYKLQLSNKNTDTIKLCE